MDILKIIMMGFMMDNTNFSEDDLLKAFDCVSIAYNLHTVRTIEKETLYYFKVSEKIYIRFILINNQIQSVKRVQIL